MVQMTSLGRNTLIKNEFLVHLLIPFLVCIVANGYQNVQNSTSINRESFPPSFVFGIGSSAYQYEGATAEGGRKPCIWDTYIQKYPEQVKDHSNANIATDQYHRYKEDVSIMKDIGVDVYRFSISWSRVLPDGGLRGGVNQEGINYYNNLINELISNGIKPIVTLFHWDPPQALEDEYQGFLSPKIIDDFGDYAELCFREFGDRVKIWATLNEPTMYAMGGYSNAAFAPGRCSNRSKCLAGNSSTEPYIVGHHLTLAHAAAVKVYREKYQLIQENVFPSGERNGIPIGTAVKGSWIYSYPQGLQQFLLYVKDRYNDPLMYITENGVGDPPVTPPSIFVDDKPRIEYIESHLTHVLEAIRHGAKVQGYTAWSLLDNFEWLNGYSNGAGIVFVDRINGLKRIPKQSAFWFKSFLTSKNHTSLTN